MCVMDGMVWMISSEKCNKKGKRSIYCGVIIITLCLLHRQIGTSVPIRVYSENPSEIDPIDALIKQRLTCKVSFIDYY